MHRTLVGRGYDPADAPNRLSIKMDQEEEKI